MQRKNRSIMFALALSVVLGLLSACGFTGYGDHPAPYPTKTLSSSETYCYKEDGSGNAVVVAHDVDQDGVPSYTVLLMTSIQYGHEKVNVSFSVNEPPDEQIRKIYAGGCTTKKLKVEIIPAVAGTGAKATVKVDGNTISYK